MSRFWFLFVLFSFLSCSEKQAQGIENEGIDHKHSIPHSPENYICYRTESVIDIDGIMNEKEWQMAAWTKSFVDIEGKLKPNPFLDTRVKMMWDDKYFYFFAKMEEPHIWAKLTQRDAVIFYDDDFEIFIDPDGDSHNYYEFEVNAFNTLWELILLRPYRADRDPKVLDNWNIPDIQSAVHIEGTINDPSDTDQFWSVEMAIPWTALMELAPLRKNKIPISGDQWRVNFSRVDWTMKVIDGKYEKEKDSETGKSLPENNWVWSPTGFINMHMPEQWGYVQFSEKRVGEAAEEFVEDQDLWVKDGLWNLYFQQRKYHKQNNTFTNDLKHLSIPELPSNSCKFQPEIYTTPNMFEIIAESCTKKGQWSIRQDGKIQFFPYN